LVKVKVKVKVDFSKDAARRVIGDSMVAELVEAKKNILLTFNNLT